jgi:hypothetical protein
VPIEEHHEYYCSDEIEIWEVTTLQFRSDKSSLIHAQRIHRHASQIGSSSLTMLNWGGVEEVRAIMRLSSNNDITESDRNDPIELCIKQDIHVGIGNYLWPSSVVLSRCVGLSKDIKIFDNE